MGNGSAVSTAVDLDILSPKHNEKNQQWQRGGIDADPPWWPAFLCIAGQRGHYVITTY